MVLKALRRQQSESDTTGPAEAAWSQSTLPLRWRRDEARRTQHDRLKHRRIRRHLVGTELSWIAEVLSRSAGSKPHRGDKWSWLLRSWPLLNVVVRHPPLSEHSLIADLVAAGFKVIYCAASNRSLRNVELDVKSRHPNLRIQRRISKGQHLVEQLELIGINDFSLTYYRPASPYALGALDKVSTLQDLRSALDAAGFPESDHVTLFQQEYEDYDQRDNDELRGWDFDVFLFTSVAFNAQLTSRRRAWWELLGIPSGLHRMDNPRDPSGPQIDVPIGCQKIVVIYDDPPLRDFDEERIVDPANVDSVATATKRLKLKRIPTRPTSWYEQTKQARYNRLVQSLPPRFVHRVVRRDDALYEKRPAEQYIGTGLSRGYSKYSSAQPKILLLTENELVAEAAYVALSRRGPTLWWNVETRRQTLVGFERILRKDAHRKWKRKSIG